MTFDLTILGSNSATPANGRHPSAQVLNVNDRLYLIDCGEGTQMRMNEYHIRRNRIHQIFISHLHGDHIFGLMGLLTTYSLNGRKEPLDIYAPKGLKEIIDVQVLHTDTYLSYPLSIHVVDPTQHRQIFEDENVAVYTIPLDHRIPTCGYLFREQNRLLNIIPEQFEKFNIPFSQINGVKKGLDGITPDGKTIPNTDLTLPPYKPRTFAYCSDTAFKEDIIPIISKCDLLYHEATFGHDRLDRAITTKHTTTVQAGTIALKASVKHLIIGHFSSRYIDLKPLLEEARMVFKKSSLAIEGNRFSVDLEREPC